MCVHRECLYSENMLRKQDKSADVAICLASSRVHFHNKKGHGYICPVVCINVPYKLSYRLIMPCIMRTVFSSNLLSVFQRVLSLHMRGVAECNTNSPAVMKDRRMVVLTAASVRRPPFVTMPGSVTSSATFEKGVKLSL